MNRETIHQNYAYVTTTSNVSGAPTPVATLTIPAGKVFRMQDGTPLVLKLYASGGTEMERSAKIYLAWQAPVGETKYQIGRTLPYGIFRDLSVANQYDINTQARRLIEFTDEEIQRFQNGQMSIISGLTADYKILLIVESTTVVDWTYAGCQFSFDMLVMSEQEFLAEKTGKRLPVVK
jgi:hypothetical protein